MTAKKLLALVLALVLCVGTLAACDSKPAETTAPTTAPAQTTAPTETTAAPTETQPAEPLKNVDIYPISSDHTFTVATTKANAAEAEIWAKMVDTIGLKVEFQSVSQEQMPLLFLDKSSMPDMVFHPTGMSAAKVNELGKNGLLINYADYLDMMPNLQKTIEKYPQLLDSVLQEDGAFYMLPGTSRGLLAPGNLFYIRLDHTAAAGWEELPATAEEFLQMCEDLKNYYKDVEGYVPMVCNGAASLKYNGAYCNFFFPAFGDLMRSDITVNEDATEIHVGFATEQFKHYLEFMHELFEKGYMDPECFVAESNTSKAKMIEGSTTMNPFATYMSPDNFASGNIDLQVMSPITSEYQSEQRWAFPNSWVARQYLITSECEDIESAILFMDALYAPRENPLNEEGTMWSISLWIGEYGVDFTINEEEGSYEILPHEGWENGTTWANTNGNGSQVASEWPYYENSGTASTVKALGVRDVLMPHDVGLFYTNVLLLTDDEQDIYNDAWADIENKVIEMNAAFITGQADLEKDWDAYINSLYDMGLQDVIDVYQAALDRYNAR